MNLTTLWFINPSPDFEREQWTLLAYHRDATADLEARKLEPFYSDIKKRIQDLECFLATRTVVSKLGRKEKKLLKEFNTRSDDSKENQEVYKIVKWAMKKLQELKKEYHKIWREVESAFNMYYVGEKPVLKVDKGIMMIRYAGSDVTEVYRFWDEDGKAMLSWLEYTQDEYAAIKERLQDEYPEEVFIIAESVISFNTKITSMPFLADTLERKVMK